MTVDITGLKFGRLTALHPTDKRCGGFVVWRCRCDCGKAKDINNNNLRRGLTRSCGCLAAEGHVRHGHARRGRHTQVYDCWIGMRSRCRNPNNKCYLDYGGRRIDYCERWELFENFCSIWASPRPVRRSIASTSMATTSPPIVGGRRHTSKPTTGAKEPFRSAICRCRDRRWTFKRHQQNLNQWAVA